MQQRTRVAIALIGVILSGLVISSCSNPTASQPEVKKYTVTFDAKGGDPAPAEQTVEEGKKVARPGVDPAKDGFVFGGWFTDAGYSYGFNDPVLKNTSLTAKWLCEITFSPGEGVFDSATSPTVTITVEPDTPITAPKVTRTGWNLAGWTVDSSAATPAIYALQDGAERSITLTAVWTKCLVVEFNDNGATSSTTYPTQYLMPGGKIVKPSVNPVKRGYIFRFWSANGTTEFDFTPGVTDNVSLTAVYGLDISSVYCSTYSKEITVYLNTGAKSPVAGEITFTARVNSGEAIPVVATLKEFSSVSYNVKAIYTYSQIVESSFDTDLSVIITAHTSVAEESALLAITIPRLLEPSGFTAVAAEKCVKLTWNSGSANIAGYKITYFDHLGVAREITGLSEYTTQRAITGLQNNHEYAFKLFAIDDNGTWTKGVSASATPAMVKSTTDWLFIQYMDGDNNLNDNLWVDINEMEYGLYQKTASVSAKVVVLWDGWAGKGTESPNYGSTGTRILELGTDSSNTSLSSATTDLSHTASWLDSGEVDMSSRQTLENFLAWVNERYDATHVVLGFSNHGGGPRLAAQSIKLPDGRVVSKPSGRAMCWDDSVGGQTFLSTRDVSTALDNVGYGTANKLGMIVLDVCLGGAVEEAYEYRDYADYFVASPNNIPGTGLNYVDLIGQLTATDTMSSVGKRMVYDYRWANYFANVNWDAFLAQYTNFTSSNVGLFYAGNTLSCVNLAKMNDLKTAVDGLADVLLSAGGDNAYTGLTKGGISVSISYRNAMKELWIRPGSPMNYMGTFTWLYDIGYVADRMAYCSASTIGGEANPNAWTALNTAATNVTTALQAAIEYSWRDGYHNTPLYYNALSSTPGIPYGLSISGETFATSTSGGTTTLVDGTFPDFYTTEHLAFAASSWATLLDSWF
jgi:clostripain